MPALKVKARWEAILRMQRTESNKIKNISNKIKQGRKGILACGRGRRSSLIDGEEVYDEEGTDEEVNRQQRKKHPNGEFELSARQRA